MGSYKWGYIGPLVWVVTIAYSYPAYDPTLPIPNREPPSKVQGVWGADIYMLGMKVSFL